MQINKRLSMLTMLLVILVYIGINLGNNPSQVDDSFISYRYARNLVQGNGLVYNLGERVEGITNLLWTLMVAGGMYFGVDAPIFAHWLSVIFSGILLFVSFVFAFRLYSSPLAFLVPLAIYCSAPFAVWSLSGMETPFHALLVVGSLWLAYEEKWLISCLLAGLCFWSRPDGGLVGLAILIPAFFSCRQKGKEKEWLGALSLWLILLGSLTVLRLVYYGQLVPNTFQAKVGGIPLVRGLEYASSFYLAGVIFLLPLAMMEIKNRRLLPVWVFVLSHSVYVFLIGGDVFSHGRFFLPVLSLFLIVAIGASRRLDKPYRYLTVAVLMICWGFFSEFIPVLREKDLQQVIKFREASQRNGEHYANLLANFDGPIACIGIGRFGYFSDAHILDMVGLVSPEVAKKKGTEGFLFPGHQASNPDWILSQNPSVIVIDPDYVMLPCQIEMLRHPEFQSHYSRYGEFFVRKDLLLNPVGPSIAVSSAME